jgi:hypothetical protein
VRKTARITSFGKPMAEALPPSPEPRTKRWIGSMEGTILFQGDIVAPAVDEED